MSPQVCACVAGGVLSNRTTEEERERPLAFFLVSLVLQRRMMEVTKLPSSPLLPHTVRRFHHRSQKRPDMVRTFSVKPGQPFRPVAKGCRTCGGKGAIECPGCKGTGKNKKNGNIFERWKCFDCQGFGLKSCPVCGKGGLTPEQRGER